MIPRADTLTRMEEKTVHKNTVRKGNASKCILGLL